MNTGSFKIRKSDIPYRDVELPVKELAFYPKNPRLYSWLASEVERDQEDIQERLQAIEHVKALRAQIERDGQVNDPLYVTTIPDDHELAGRYKYQVLEGNRRLAALNMKKPNSRFSQAMVRCYVLDFSNYSELRRNSLIFSLIGGFHIEGKQKWEPYELAAFLYERTVMQKIGVDLVAKESGMTKKEVQDNVDAYIMMKDHGDSTSSHWSYYLTYVENSTIKKHRDKQVEGELDKRVAEMIKQRCVPKATTFRDKLPLILTHRPAKKVFMKEDMSDAFDEAASIVLESGTGDRVLQTLTNARRRFAKEDFQKKVIRLLTNSRTESMTAHQLKGIRRHVNAMLKNKECKDD